MSTETLPRIDPTMHVYCSIHSEQKGKDGGHRGPVAATFGKDEWGRRGYSCWHCATARFHGKAPA